MARTNINNLTTTTITLSQVIKTAIVRYKLIISETAVCRPEFRVNLKRYLVRHGHNNLRQADVDRWIQYHKWIKNPRKYPIGGHDSKLVKRIKDELAHKLKSCPKHPSEGIRKNVASRKLGAKVDNSREMTEDSRDADKDDDTTDEEITPRLRSKIHDIKLRKKKRNLTKKHVTKKYVVKPSSMRLRSSQTNHSESEQEPPNAVQLFHKNALHKNLKLNPERMVVDPVSSNPERMVVDPAPSNPERMVVDPVSSPVPSNPERMRVEPVPLIENNGGDNIKCLQSNIGAPEPESTRVAGLQTQFFLPTTGVTIGSGDGVSAFHVPIPFRREYHSSASELSPFSPLSPLGSFPWSLPPFASFIDFGRTSSTRTHLPELLPILTAEEIDAELAAIRKAHESRFVSAVTQTSPGLFTRQQENALNADQIPAVAPETSHSPVIPHYSGDATRGQGKGPAAAPARQKKQKKQTGEERRKRLKLPLISDIHRIHRIVQQLFNLHMINSDCDFKELNASYTYASELLAELSLVYVNEIKQIVNLDRNINEYPNAKHYVTQQIKVDPDDIAENDNGDFCDASQFELK